MTQITWVEGMPSDSSLVVQAPEFVRSVKRNIATGLATESFWPGSGGGSDDSIGHMRAGASKSFVTAQSNIVAAGSNLTTGRLFFTSDTSRIISPYISSEVWQLGTVGLAEHATAHIRAYWLEQAGSFTTTPVGGVIAGNVSFPRRPYSGVPSVSLSCSSTSYRYQTSDITTGGFTSNVSGPASLVTVWWTSLGTFGIP